jgi:hypothetical protein
MHKEEINDYEQKLQLAKKWLVMCDIELKNLPNNNLHHE